MWGINTQQLLFEADLLSSVRKRRMVVEKSLRNNSKDAFIQTIYIPSIQNTEKMSFAVTIWHHQLDALRN